MNRRAGVPLLLVAVLATATPSCFTIFVLSDRTPWDAEEEEEEEEVEAFDGYDRADEYDD